MYENTVAFYSIYRRFETKMFFLTDRGFSTDVISIRNPSIMSIRIRQHMYQLTAACMLNMEPDDM
jgi:hypothetical protein